MSDTFYDIASLMEWFDENETCWIIPYIEQHFDEVSWGYQLAYMKKHLYFTKKIIEDYKMEYSEKLLRFMEMISYGKSKIITIIGGRGSGKSALAMFLVEKMKEESKHQKIYYVKKGDRPSWLPKWMRFVSDIEMVPNNSFAVLDETALEYGARDYATEGNKSLTERLVILRHKDTSLLLITQHSRLIDINIRRLSDILIYKNGADLSKESGDDEEKKLILNRLLPKTKEKSLIEIKGINAYWQIETGLASFWDDEIVSKTFKDYNPEAVKREKKANKLKAEVEAIEKKAIAKKKSKEIFKAEDLIPI